MIQEFSQRVEDMVRAILGGVHTAIPATLKTFDADTCTAQVIPLGQYKTPDGRSIPYPAVSEVPVLFPQGGGQGTSIVWPLKEGDGCLLIASEQSLDLWKYGGDTGTDLKFDLTNAIVIPGLFNVGSDDLKEAVKQNAMIIRHGGVRMLLTSNQATIEGDLVVTGNIQINGGAEVSQDLSAANVSASENVNGKYGIFETDATSNGISLSSHVHGLAMGTTDGPQ